MTLVNIAIGKGGFPFGLSFSRSYSSHDRLQEGPLGRGWRHNYDICAKVTSDSFRALGSGSAIDAAAAIVSLYVTKDTLESNTSSFTYTLVASMIQSWLMDQMNDNVITVDQGGSEIEFVKNLDGEFHPLPGTKLKIDPNETDGTMRMRDANGRFYEFGSDGLISEWSDPHGNTVAWAYSSGKLSSVTSKIGATTCRSLTFTYTGDHITKVEDSANRDVAYAYDTDDQLTNFTHLDGTAVTSYTYDTNNVGQITEVYLPTDTVDPFITNVYDALGRVKQRINANDIATSSYLTAFRLEIEGPNQTDPNNVTQKFSTIRWRDKYGRTIRSIDQLGRESTHAYNGVHRPTTSTSAFGTSTERTYDSNHNVIQTQSTVQVGSNDPNTIVKRTYEEHETAAGRWFERMNTSTNIFDDQTVYQYDFNDIPTHGTELGNLMKITYPDVNTTSGIVTPIETFTYNSDGQIDSQTNIEGIVTEYEYDSAANGAGRTASVVDTHLTQGLKIRTEVTYNAFGEPNSTTDAEGNVTTHEFNSAGLKSKTTGPAPSSIETTFEYDEAGRLLKTKRTTGSSHVVLNETTFNALGKVATTRGPYPKNPTQAQLDINYTQYTYDDVGRPWKVTDAEGKVTETRYYPDNKVWKVIDPNGDDTIVNTYNDDGTLAKVADALGNETSYAYNGFGGAKKTTYADGTYTEPTYDAYRRLSTMRTRDGQTITYQYDDNERLHKKILPSNTFEHTYDLAGRIIEILDNSGTINTEFDRIGRISEVNDVYGHVISYEHSDCCGKKKKITYPDNSYVTYFYDSASRVTDVNDDAGTNLAHYAYDDLNRRTAITYDNGATTAYSYDSASRVTDVNHVTNDDQHQYLYTYDKVGNRLTMTAFGSDLYTYSYDDTHQLTDVNYPSAHFMDDTTFEYDAAGNRDAVIDTSTDDYVANSLNQYNQAGSDYLDYDQNGNLVYDGVNHYLYDAENHLIRITDSLEEGNSALATATDSDLVFTTGGDVDWLSTDQEYYHDGNNTDAFAENRDSARSGVLSASQESWMQATVKGPGTLTFHMKRLGDGTSTFTLDGDAKHTGSGNWGWNELSYNVDGYGEHTFKWKYSRPASTTSDPNGLFVDYVQWVPDVTTTSLQKAVDNDHPLTTGGAPDYNGWFRYGSSEAQYDDDCAESDSDTSHGEESPMEMTALGSGTVSFFWSVSSEASADYLKFYIDGVLKDEISGEVAWTQKTYSVTGSGEHTFKWVYKKDGSVSEGGDYGRVDHVQWDGSTVETLNVAIATNSDDAEEDGDGSMSLSGDLHLGTDGGDDPTVGLRFTNLPIPQGAIITKAYVEFEAEYGQSEDAQVTVKAEDTDDAATFTTTNGDITSRTTTTASVSYWLGAWTEDEKYPSADLASVIQEVVDRTGWASGNDLALIISSTDSDTHDAQSSTGYNTYPPVLHVEYVKAGAASAFGAIKYAYDAGGRRIEKDVDGVVTRFVYDDADNVLAEYNDNGDLLRKYVYGPRIDEPICMIEVADSNAIYYYHADALGSVVALTDVNGNSVQTYTYSVYGQVAASDPDHTNPYLYTGRRYDVETGMYYYRARMYSPHLGRFMQTDPIGYGDGLNWYRYARNNPLRYRDPWGTEANEPNDMNDPNISPAPTPDPTPDDDEKDDDCKERTEDAKARCKRSLIILGTGLGALCTVGTAGQAVLCGGLVGLLLFDLDREVCDQIDLCDPDSPWGDKNPWNNPPPHRPEWDLDNPGLPYIGGGML